MSRKAVSGIKLALLFIGMLTLAFDVQPVKASGTIYIRADGSVDPPTANITTVDNIIYTFIGNINESIVVERDNIVVDGTGHTLQGTGSGTGIDLTRRSNVTIKNMEIKSFRSGILLGMWSSNNTISGNNITANNGNGITLWYSSTNTNIIHGNNITNSGNGIVLHDGASYNNISRNSIKGNKWSGIWLERSLGNIICGNTITTNNEIGIYFRDSSHYNSIFDNSITANLRIGVDLGASSDNNTISENDITDNGIGIRASGAAGDSSSNNTISGNTIAKNGDGVFISSGASDNVFHHNNFVDNYDHQVRLSPYYPPGKNVWDDGYPSGGNYWSDYAGVDVKSGPNQDQPSSDGIGDTPYVIDGTNQDNYPLMNPWGAPPPPSYAFTVYSLPTGVTFTVSDVSRTTPWSGTYSEGASVSLVMPETHNGYVWSHWVEDGDTNRIKTITMDTNITLTGVFAAPPVGGYVALIAETELTPSPWAPPSIALVSLIALTVVISVAYVKHRKKKQT